MTCTWPAGKRALKLLIIYEIELLVKWRKQPLLRRSPPLAVLRLCRMGLRVNRVSRAAGVILFLGESVLLCKRTFTYKGNPVLFGGYWSPFTGAIEDGESPLVCAARELFEESGLEVNFLDLKYITEIQRKNASLTLYAYELDSFFSPTLDVEHTEFGYFKTADLKTSPMPLDDPIREAIELYLNKLRL